MSYCPNCLRETFPGHRLHLISQRGDSIYCGSENRFGLGVLNEREAQFSRDRPSFRFKGLDVKWSNAWAGSAPLLDFEGLRERVERNFDVLKILFDS